MNDEVLLCGYSYHAEYFYRGNRIKALQSYLIRLQVEGTCTVRIDGQEMQLISGDLLLLRPGNVYEMWVQKDPKLEEDANLMEDSGDYFLFCRGAWIEEWWSRSPKPSWIRIEPDEALLSLWRQIIVEKCKVKEDKRELLSYLLRALCLRLDGAISKAPTHGLPYPAFRMKRFIEMHALRTFKVEEVAQYAGLSVSRASHFFKECYGKSIIQYALEIRLSSALERMKYTYMPLEEISDSCGFRSYSFFHRAFKEKYGLSPAAYRKQWIKSKN